MQACNFTYLLEMKVKCKENRSLSNYTIKNLFKNYMANNITMLSIYISKINSMHFTVENIN